MLESTATVLWLTPHAALIRDGGSAMSCSGFVGDDYNLECDADGKTIWALADSAEELSDICDVVLRLLAASVVHSVILQQQISSRDDALLNVGSLAYLMEQCQSLKVLSLQSLELDENHCRELGVYSRPGLEIALTHCRLTSSGASALAEVLGRNQGPTKVDRCAIDYYVLANGLRGNSRLKCLTPLLFIARNSNREVLALAGALKENKGLVDLYFDYCLLSNETWDAVCDFLETHPTLQVLKICPMHIFREPPLAPAVLESQIQGLVDMLKVNMTIHTIHLNAYYREHELFRGSVVPYLETNRLRQRVRAIQKTRPMAYRAKVLGRALLAARTDPNHFWMLLSGNPEVAFPSTTAKATPAATLPTPATATSNAAAIAATVVVTVTTTLADSTTGVSVDAYVATPTICQKRKARP
jgi:hypothetical protein